MYKIKVNLQSTNSKITEKLATNQDIAHLGLFGGDFGDMHGELFSETRQDVNGDTRAEDLQTRQN